MELKQIEINKIKPNPLQPREHFDREKLKELAESIKSIGLVQPIIVDKTKNSYELVSGERRWKAHQIAKKDKMWALVKHYGGNDTQKKKELLAANQHRENLRDWEEWKFIKSVAKDEGWIHKVAGKGRNIGDMDLTMVSDSLGIAYGRLKNLYKLFEEGTTKLKQAAKKGKIGFYDASMISRLPEEEQQEIAEEALESDDGLGRTEVIERVQEKKKEAALKEPKVVPIQRFKDMFSSEIGGVHEKLNRFNDLVHELKKKKLIQQLGVKKDIQTLLKHLHDTSEILDKVLEEV